MIAEIILGIIALATTIFSYYMHVRMTVREAAEGAINAAEKLELIGEEKMKLAVEIVYDIVPVVAKPFFTKAIIQSIIQRVFDEMEEYAKKQG